MSNTNNLTKPKGSDLSTTYVSHPVFGEGEILDYRWRGTEVLIKFQSGLRLWIPTSRVLPVARQQRPISEISARRMIEAFRMGIVRTRMSMILPLVAISKSKKSLRG